MVTMEKLLATLVYLMEKLWRIAEKLSHILHYGTENGSGKYGYARGLGKGVIDKVVFCLAKFSIKFDILKSGSGFATGSPYSIPIPVSSISWRAFSILAKTVTRAFAQR